MGYADRGDCPKHRSDGHTPEKIAEQVMHIYPIIPGQKVSERNTIPPRTSTSSTAAERKKPANATPPTAAEKGENSADLIDFGEEKGPDPPAATKTRAKNGGDDISAMLQATGKDANEGPLIDFASDVKKELPSQGRASVKRTVTDSSNDAFFDSYE